MRLNRSRVDKTWLAAQLLERPRWHVPVAGRLCSERPERVAQDRCDHCGQPYCDACLHKHPQAGTRRCRMCSACLTSLERKRAGRPLGERLRGFWPALLAGVIVGALLAGGVLAINQGVAGATTSGNLVGTADQVACLQKYPDPHKLYVVGGLPLFGYPPAQLILQNCHVQPGEAVRVVGSVSGNDAFGQRFSLPLGPVTAQGGTNGVLVVTLPVPDSQRFQGSYELRFTATGHEGSAASAALSAEGNLRQPTRGDPEINGTSNGSLRERHVTFVVVKPLVRGAAQSSRPVGLPPRPSRLTHPDGGVAHRGREPSGRLADCELVRPLSVLSHVGLLCSASRWGG